jgi:chromosome segregation ATPase
MSALQDLAATVMQRYAPEIERGNKKKARLEAGAKYSDTLHRTVKQLHEDLPLEKAMLEAEIEAMSQEITEQKASVVKTQGHLAKLETKAKLTESEIKRKETYSRRLEKKQAAMAEEMERLEARRSALATTIAQEAEALKVEKQAVRAERQEVQAQMNTARAAKETYDRAAKAIEAVLTEAENETLVYDPDTGGTTMQDPTPLKNTPPKLRTQIVKLAKRLALVESNLFARIFRLDEQISRIRAFLTRNDIEPEAKIEAREIIDDAAEEEPGLG